MLKEIREQEDSRYPANTTPKPHHNDNGNKNMSHYGSKSSQYDKPRIYAVRHTDVQISDPEQDESSPSPGCEIDPDEIYNKGYYVAVINTVNEADKWGRCFN